MKKGEVKVNYELKINNYEIWIEFKMMVNFERYCHIDEGEIALDNQVSIFNK